MRMNQKNSQIIICNGGVKLKELKTSEHQKTDE